MNIRSLIRTVLQEEFTKTVRSDVTVEYQNTRRYFAYRQGTAKDYLDADGIRTREFRVLDARGNVIGQDDPNTPVPPGAFIQLSEELSLSPDGTMEGEFDTFCYYCHEPIHDTGDSSVPWIHDATGNAFCNLHSIDDLFDKEWRRSHKCTARPEHWTD